MTIQSITICGTVNDCWVINRFGSDVLPPRRQTIEDDWFDVMAALWIEGYKDISDWPQLPYQFVLRCRPIVC